MQFPAAGAALPLALDARLGAPAAAPASATMVDLGVTVSPEGELLSVGGMDPAQFGVALPMVDVSILETLGMSRLDAKLTAGGMSVIANDVELATVNWDPAQIENLPEIYTKLTGAGLPAGADSVVEVATGWLMTARSTSPPTWPTHCETVRTWPWAAADGEPRRRQPVCRGLCGAHRVRACHRPVPGQLGAIALLTAMRQADAGHRRQGDAERSDRRRLPDVGAVPAGLWTGA